MGNGHYIYLHFLFADAYFEREYYCYFCHVISRANNIRNYDIELCRMKSVLMEQTIHVARLYRNNIISYDADIIFYM